MSEPIYYTPSGVEVPLSTIQKEANAANISVEEYIANNNYTTRSPELIDLEERAGGIKMPNADGPDVYKNGRGRYDYDTTTGSTNIIGYSGRNKQYPIFGPPTDEDKFNWSLHNADQPEFLTTKRGKKIKNPKYVSEEDALPLQTQVNVTTKKQDLDIEHSNLYYNKDNNDFVNNNIPNFDRLLQEQNINPNDISGAAQRPDPETKAVFSEYVKENIEADVYGAKTNVYSDLMENSLIESDKSQFVISYMLEQDQRLNDKRVNDYILQNPEKFKDVKSIDEAKKIIYDSDNPLLQRVTQYDWEAYEKWEEESFPNLTQYKKEQLEAAKERYNNIKNRGGIRMAADAVTNPFIELIPGAFEGGRDALIWMGKFMPDVLPGGDDWAKTQNMRIAMEERYSLKNLDYFRVDGKSTTIDGIEYLKDDKGNIYDTTNNVNVTELLSNSDYKKISESIDADGIDSSDWSSRGATKQAGNVIGNVAFQVVGTKGIGAVRQASSLAMLSRAGKMGRFKSAAQYKQYVKRAAEGKNKGSFIKQEFETFGVKLPKTGYFKDPRVIDASLFQSLYGMTTGYNNTHKAAINAGLSQDEAESLATTAQLGMGALYFLTGPLNPRLPALDKLDDLFKNKKVYQRLVDDYKKTGSYTAASNSFADNVKRVLPSSTTVKTFAQEGGGEFVQENIQQLGETKIVNPLINEEAEFELLNTEYSLNDFIQTSILSFAAGGLVGGLSVAGSGNYTKNKIGDLYTVSQNIDGTKARFDALVEKGTITQRQANQILKDAENVAYAVENENIPNYILDVDPNAYVKVAGLQKQLAGLKNKRSKLGNLSDPEINNQIEKLENQIIKIDENSRKKLLDQDIKTAEPYAKVKKFKNARQAQKAGITGLDSSTDGMLEKDGVIYINEEVALSGNYAVTSHEVLHKILKTQFNIDGKATTEQKKILNDFKKILKSQGLDQIIEERIKKYKEEGYDTENANMDEYFTAFSDLLGSRAIDVEALRQNQSFSQQIKKFFEEVLAKVFGVNRKFETADQLYDFIIDYQKSFQKGKLSSRAKVKIKAGEKIKGDTKKSLTKLSPEIEKEVGENIKSLQEARKNAEDLAKKFNKPYQKTPQETKIENNIIQKIKPTVDSFVESRTKDLFDPIPKDARKGIDRDTFRESMKTDIHTMVFDEYKALQTIEKFIVNRGYLRSNALAKSLGIKETIDKQIDESTENILDEENKIIGEDKIYNIEKAFTPSQIEGIDAELLTIARIFTTKISETALNKKSSDFIRDFKKRAKKSQAISLIKESLKVKGKVNPNKFLRLKRPILEGTTTTYLSRAYPEVIEKSVDGKYEGKIFNPNFVKFPEWQGKKIDREKTSTDSAGRTAGHDLVRRRKKAANVLSNIEFLQKSFTNIKIEDNKVLPIDPKKAMKPVSQNSIDSPIAQVATEALLSRFVTKLIEGNNEISNAFEKAQAIKGQILAENYVNNIAMQAEEGGVKKSLTFNYKEAASRLVRIAYKRGIANVVDVNSNIVTNIKIPRIGTIEPEELNKVSGYLSDGRPLPSLGSLLLKLNKENLILSIDEFMPFIRKDPVIQKALQNEKAEFKFALTRNSDVNAKNDYAKEIFGLREDLGSLVMAVFPDGGLKIFGFHNRFLDPAGKKVDVVATTTAKLNNFNAKTIYLTNPDGSFVPGEFYERLNNNNNKLKPKKVSNLNLQDVEIYNSQKGIMKKIGEIMQAKIPLKKKLELLTNESDLIKNANVANIGLAKHILRTIRKRYKAGKMSAKTVLALFQQQTSADEGFRGLSTFNYVTLIGDIDQGHAKGEHLLANAITMFKLVKAIIDPSIGNIQFENDIESALMFHDQWMHNRSDLDFIDVLGKTINAAELRMLADQDGLKNIFTIDGKPAADIIPGRIEAFKLNEAINKSLKDGQLPPLPQKKSISVDLNKEINEMISRQKGVRPETTYSAVVARKQGANKGRFKFFLPATAEDFRGLTSYTFAGKGKQGEADQKFFEDNLVKPYVRGVAAMESARQAFKNDYKTLLKTLPQVKKKLNKKIPDSDFTHDQAIRVHLYTNSGFEVPGISKRDAKFLNSYVANDPELKQFANALQDISKKEKWVEPESYWDVGSILQDINSIDQTVSRKEYLAEFIENVDIIFDEKNLNKIEALYGSKHREALEDIIRRMKSGSNRPPGTGDRQTTAWLNWVNNSVGTIMFFNRRSALLQTISFANFINWSDNNPLKAAQAFANQPAYWKAWVEIFNSDKLKQRRGGLKSDVQEQEIANQAKNSKNKLQAIISYLLKIGFTPTQIADSVAIATGGSTFLINRTKTYEKQGMDYESARAKAFEDFSLISDETQQSGDPMLISKQQAGHLGRFILSFQNTPMQYTRLMKKAALDIINRRGSDKENLSKIIYYGFVQNLLFAALQNALFALLPDFDPEDDEEGYERLIDSKQNRIINSMVDTVLRGSGLAGAVVSTLKNSILRYMKEEKKGFTADHAYTILELSNVSPPIGSKLRKVYGAIQTKKFDQDIIDARKWETTKDGRLNLSPSYKILGNLVSAGANVPLDRAIAEVEAISEALNSQNTAAQRLALALGWRTWDVNIRNEDHELIKTEAKAKRKAAGIEKAKETRKRKSDAKKEILNNMPRSFEKTYANMNKKERKAWLDKEVEKYLKNN